jgi:thioredoxin-related protein
VKVLKNNKTIRLGILVFAMLALLIGVAAFAHNSISHNKEVAFDFAKESKKAENSFVESNNAMASFNQLSHRSNKLALVFFQKDCPYCEGGAKFVKETANKNNSNVLFIDRKSATGKVLSDVFHVKYASTIIVIDPTISSEKSQKNGYLW